MFKDVKKYGFIIIMFMITAVFFSLNTLCYFDNSSHGRNENLAIGQWDFMTETATYQTVSDLINYKYDSSVPEELQKINYLNSVLLDSGTNTVDEVFQNYKMYEIDETIELIDIYITNFLYFNNGVLSYPATPVSPITLNLGSVLNYGNTCTINQVLLTADLLNNEIMTVTLGMSAAGVDISDFIAEIIIDRNAFALSSPFAYKYKHTGMSKSVNVKANKVNLSTLPSASFDTEVRRNTVTTLYHHIINAPAFTGDYCRFPTGPSMYLTAPSSFTVNNSVTVTGTYLRGSANGSETQLVLEISNMASRYNPSVTIVPIKIIVSRGVSNNGSSINQTNIMPDVTMKVTG